MKIIEISEIQAYMDFRGQKWPNARDALAFAYQELGEVIEATADRGSVPCEVGDLVQMLTIAYHGAGLGDWIEFPDKVEQMGGTPSGLAFAATLLQIVVSMGHINDGLMRQEAGWVRNAERTVPLEKHFSTLAEEIAIIGATHVASSYPDSDNPIRDALLTKWKGKGFAL